MRGRARLDLRVHADTWPSRVGVRLGWAQTQEWSCISDLKRHSPLKGTQTPENGQFQGWAVGERHPEQGRAGSEYSGSGSAGPAEKTRPRPSNSPSSPSMNSSVGWKPQDPRSTQASTLRTTLDVKSGEGTPLPCRRFRRGTLTTVASASARPLMGTKTGRVYGGTAQSRSVGMSTQNTPHL